MLDPSLVPNSLYVTGVSSMMRLKNLSHLIFLRNQQTVDLCIFLEGDHASEECSHRSSAGFLMYLNSAIIIWYSKKQSTIKTCASETEFVVMKLE